jgi:arginase family enzyme
MLKELITPITELTYLKELNLNPFQFGHDLKNNHWDSNNLPKAAILGIPEGRTSSCPSVAEGADQIRKHLYTLSVLDGDFSVVDLGNVKNGKDPADTFAAVKMISEELSALNIPLLILGGSQDITEPLVSGFEKNELKITIIDDRIDNCINHNSYNDEIFLNNLPFRASMNMIAGQSYFIGEQGKEDVSETFKGTVYTLGQLRSDIREMEPILRESDVVSFDFGALKLSEAPGQIHLSPNGLTGEEACQLSWYAGMATSPLWFGLFGYSPSLDPSSSGGMMAAQICWYFLNGISKRMDQAPADEATDFIHYHIQLDELEEPISFLKHPITKRWWMEVPSENCDYFPLRIPCSKKDYKKACKNQIPTRWWNYFNAHNA